MIVDNKSLIKNVIILQNRQCKIGNPFDRSHHWLGHWQWCVIFATVVLFMMMIFVFEFGFLNMIKYGYYDSIITGGSLEFKTGWKQWWMMIAAQKYFKFISTDILSVLDIKCHNYQSLPYFIKWHIFNLWWKRTSAWWQWEHKCTYHY